MRGVSVAPVMERLEANIVREPNSGCWLWSGLIKSNGYASFGVKIDGRWVTKNAHKFAFEQIVGKVPAGMVLDHKCRTRCCVRPDHMEVVTQSENLSRSPLMGRQKNKVTCPRGHFYSGTDNRGRRICAPCYAQNTRNYRKRKQHDH